MRKLFPLLALGVLMVGCSGTAVSENDQKKIREEFSNDNYEKAMRASGRGAELDAQKQREAQYKSEQDASQH